MTLEQAERIADLRQKWQTLDAMRLEYINIGNYKNQVLILEQAMDEILTKLWIIFDAEERAMKNV